MGFSTSIKQKILVDTARHCCVCHRYKGVKVEVHHIAQEASGGENTYENAISLCFDCHADAGHYNPLHPRGTKFSPSELKKAKKQWIDLVKQHDIHEPTEKDKLLCRYFVCESYDNLCEIDKGDLSAFPVTNPLLAKNEILSALGKIIRTHPQDYRHASIWGESTGSEEEYFKKHPDAELTDKSTGKYSYFRAVRIPQLKELENIRNQDGLLALMLEASELPPEVCAVVTCYEDACAGIEALEEYVLRSIWGGFAAITNIHDRPITLESVSGEFSRNSGFSNFSMLPGKTDKIALPKMPIEPGTTVLVPVAIIIPPLTLPKIERWSTEVIGEIGDEQIQEITRSSVDSEASDQFLVYGGQFSISAIEFREEGVIRSQNIHSFDLDNMYLIDKCWQCGSCPHLFFKGEKISYERELLAHCQYTSGEDSFVVPNDVKSIIIAEIEEETTYIDQISINGVIFKKDIILRKSDYVEISVPSGAVVEIVGKYVPNTDVFNSIPQGAIRNNLIGRFIYAHQ